MKRDLPKDATEDNEVEANGRTLLSQHEATRQQETAQLSNNALAAPARP